jgi:hypothetical protein
MKTFRQVLCYYSDIFIEELRKIVKNFNIIDALVGNRIIHIRNESKICCGSSKLALSSYM